MQIQTQPVASQSRPVVRDPSGGRGALRSLTREHGFEPLRVEGRLPPELGGTLYRNGPGILEQFGRRYGHWFDGDGAMSAVRFADGRAEGAVRVVRSRGLEDERRSGRSKYAGYGTKARWPLPLGRVKNTANTSVLPWAGRLFALWEAGLPTELDPATLETIGERDLDGVVPFAFSAHPHAVPARDRIYNFGVRYGRRTLLDVFELEPGGRARRLVTTPLPGPTMVHDFIATERHLVFFAPPLRLRVLRLLTGLSTYSDALAWRPDEGTEVIVVPIDEPDRVTRFTAEPFYQWHFANAFERGDELVVDFVRYADFGSNAWLEALFRDTPRPAISSALHRAVIDPRRRSLRSEPVFEGSCEFPRVDPRRQAREHRFTWIAGHSSPAAARELQDAILRVDAASGAVSQTTVGDGRYVSEPVFVPRPGGRDEDDGWALTLVYDAAEDRSHVAVLDGRDLSVVARAWFDHHLPATFHGAFLPA